jgi:hypothetical protein
MESVEDSDEPPTKRVRVKKELEDYPRVAKPVEQAKPAKPRLMKRNRGKVGPIPQERDTIKDNILPTTKTTVTKMKGKDGKSAKPKSRLVKPPPPVKKETKEHDLREIIEVSSDREYQGRTRERPDVNNKVFFHKSQF